MPEAVPMIDATFVPYNCQPVHLGRSCRTPCWPSLDRDGVLPSGERHGELAEKRGRLLFAINPYAPRFAVHYHQSPGSALVAQFNGLGVGRAGRLQISIKRLDAQLR